MAVTVLPREGGQPDVIAVLEESLAMARDGNLRGVVVVAHTRRNGTSSTLAVGDGDVAHLVCALERAKGRLLDL